MVLVFTGRDGRLHQVRKRKCQKTKSEKCRNQDLYGKISCQPPQKQDGKTGVCRLSDYISSPYLTKKKKDNVKTMSRTTAPEENMNVESIDPMNMTNLAPPPKASATTGMQKKQSMNWNIEIGNS
jgi:hypothetical protein